MVGILKKEVFSRSNLEYMVVDPLRSGSIKSMEL